MFKWFKGKEDRRNASAVEEKQACGGQDPLHVIGHDEKLRYKVASKIDEAESGQSIELEDVFGESAGIEEEMALIRTASIMMRHSRPRHIPEEDEIRGLEEKGASGDPGAQMDLFFFYTSKGDQDKAIVWLKKAADQDDAEALTMLGGVYQHGDGVEQDSEKAVECYEKAIIEDGYDDALMDLGLCYIHGKGVEKNLREARYFMERAAKQGNAPARYNMGWIYETGAGVEPDIKEAVRWYELSAECGYGDAYSCLRSIFYDSKNYDRLLYWTERFIKYRSPLAMFEMGCLLLDGEGVEKDEKKGFKYMEESASLGFPDAVFECARCYSKGTGVDADPVKVNEYLLKAAGLRHPQAEYIWAVSHMSSYPQRAMAFLRDAAAQGHPQAVDYLRGRP